MRFFLIGFIVIIFSMLPEASYGQPGGGGPAGEPSVPITGIEILISLGGFLGLRKLILNKRKKTF